MVRFLQEIVEMSLFLFVLLYFQPSRCDWASEWLMPLQFQYKQDQLQNGNPEPIMTEASKTPPEKEDNSFPSTSNDFSVNAIRVKLESTIQSAKDLADTLKTQIREMENKERYLKETIVFGKNGVTTLVSSTTNRSPRTFIIRDGFWSICSGMVQSPIASQSSKNFVNKIFSTPRCIGQEIPTVRDPCVFNSIIKYEVIPTIRRPTYQEDDYLCLKPNFNNTLEQYVSVSKQTLNDTCKRGTVKRLSDNILKCGLRILSEYTYYPNQNALSSELQEYCDEKDGACKLIVAWHLSNSSIENFDMLTDDRRFKMTFLKAGPSQESLLIQ